MKYKKIIIYTLVVILFIIIYIYGYIYTINVNNKKGTSNISKIDKNIYDYNKSISGDKNSLISDYGKLTTTTNINKLIDSIKKDDFILTQKNVSNIFIDIRKNKLINENDLRIEALKYIKVGAILEEGNFLYKEKQKSNEAITIIENDILKNSKTGNTYFSNYFLGYAKEIVQDYSGALKYYNKALNIISNKEKQIYSKAIVLNQIGHIYDLIGDIENANKYYLLSEKLGLNLYLNLANRGRYEYRKNNITLAEEYFNKVLKLNANSFINSEMYSDLSIIYLSKKDGLDKSIKYAQLGIKENPLYPNNYNSIGIGYISKGGDNMEKSLSYLDKAIEIYPQNSNAYRWKGIYYYIKDDYKNAIINFKKQLELTKEDILLMKNEKENYRKSSLYDLSKTYALDNNVEKSIYYLNLLLNGNNKYYYVSFLAELSVKNGPFDKLKTNKKFILNLNKLVKLYINK